MAFPSSDTRLATCGGAGVSDVPTERPTLLCLVTRHEPAHERLFAVVDLLALPYYEDHGWTFVALDPETESRWTAWRTAHPGAA